MPKFPVLKMARGLTQVFRPVEVTDIDERLPRLHRALQR